MMKHSFLAWLIVLVFVLVLGGGVYSFFIGTLGFSRQITIPAAAPTTHSSSSEELPPSAQEARLVTTAPPPSTYYAPGEKVTLAEPEKLPEQKAFQAFSYSPSVGKTVTVSGSCADAYWAFLVFDAKDDYRNNPAAARVNRAMECPSSGAFRVEFHVSDFNLPAGSYYAFVADQGNKGSWYNPR